MFSPGFALRQDRVFFAKNMAVARWIFFLRHPFTFSQCIVSEHIVEALMQMMDFVALYRGRTISEAQVVAVSVDTRLVQHVAATMLATEAEPGKRTEDDVLDLLQSGRRQALRRIVETHRSTAAREHSSAPFQNAQKGGDNLHDADSQAKLND